MPSLLKTQNIKGKVAYVYDISKDDITTIVQDMMANADVPFSFIGKIDEYQSELSNPMKMVEGTLNKEGSVAASAVVAGTPLTVQFLGSVLRVMPEDGSQSIADMFVGADADMSMFVDDDDYDPFASAADNFPVPDPRRSQALTNRYGDPEDMDFEDEYASSSKQNQSGEVIKVTDWLFTLIILMIPVVNIVALIIWLISKKTNQSKKNFLKVQLIFMIVGALFAGLIGVMAYQSGLVSFFLNPQQAIYEQMYNNANLNANMNTNIDADDENSNANANSNNTNSNSNNTNSNIFSNMNSNTNMNGNAATNEPATNMAGTPGVGGLSQNTTGLLNIDNVSRVMLPNGQSIAVITLTMVNFSPLEAAPAALIDITGNQGQNALNANFEAVSGFAPETFNMPIQPSQSGTFQISYFLVDDQDLQIKAFNKETHEMILDATQVLH